MATLQNPPIASPIVDIKTGLPTATFSSWMVRLQNRAGGNTGGLAPADPEYIIKTSNSDLTNAQVLASLSSGFMKVATTTGTISSTGNTTIQAGDIASNAVTTVKILDANVTLGKLASGITPSHVIKFAGQYTTTGGGASEDYTIAGVAATDLCFVQLRVAGATPRTILSAYTSTNKITVDFSGDPSNDHQVYYQVLRAAS